MGLLRKKVPPVPSRRLEHSEQGRVRAPLPDLDARYTFRRNRTLTGSLSSNVSSVNEHNAELKSDRVHTHHLRHYRRRVSAALVVVVIVAIGMAYLLYQSILGATIFTVAPRSIDTALYANAIHDYLLKYPLERFRFSLNTNSLTRYLQANGYPEIESIDPTVTAAGFGKAGVHVTFRTPAVVWRTGGAIMFVDANGNAFSRNYHQEPNVQVVDQTGIPAQGNQVLASNSFLGFIGKVIGRMKENNYTVTHITLPASTTRQVQVTVQGASYPIKFSIDRPAGEQAEDAARAIRYLASNGINAQYLDVRVSGRAFYQ